jgi:hypothetical protein
LSIPHDATFVSDRFCYEIKLICSLAAARSWNHEASVIQVAQRTLENGLEVWVWPQPQSLFHTALLGFHGGQELGEKPGMNTAVLWSRQYRTLSPPSSRGLLSRFNIGADDTLASIRGTGRNFAATLEQLHLQVDFSVWWPPQQFTHQLQIFKREEEDPNVQLGRDVSRQIFGDHVYGRRATVDQVRSITPNEIHNWLAKVRHPSNALLIVVGDANPEEVFQAAQQEFGSWDNEPKTQGAIPEPPPLTRPTNGRPPSVLFKNHPGVTQVNATFRCALPNVDADSYATARLFERLFYQQVWKQLREETQASYHVVPHLSVFRGGAATLMLQADIDYGRLVAAMRAMKGVTELNAPSQVTPERLDYARAELVIQNNWANTNSPVLAERLLFAWNQAWPPDVALNVARYGFEVTLDQVKRFEATCRQSAVLGFSGDEARLKSAWDNATEHR